MNSARHTHQQQMLDQRRAQEKTAAAATTNAIEYLSYAINSVLYLRGLYPSNSFRQVEHQATGLTLMVSNDQSVSQYLGAVLSQIAHWLAEDKIKAVSLVIFPDGEPPADGEAADEGDVVERWTFQFRRNTNDDMGALASHSGQTSSVHLANALRHLTASAGMLPSRKSVSTFEVITYNNNMNPSSATNGIPRSWELSDPMELEGADELPLRPFDCSGLYVDGFITFYAGGNQQRDGLDATAKYDEDL